MDEIEKHIGRLFSSELQFRLAVAVRTATQLNKQPLDVPSKWAYGKHTVESEDIVLRQDQADHAAQYLERSATYLMAVEMKEAIETAEPDANNSNDQDIHDAFQISYLLRNAFVHGPLNPTWSINAKYRDKLFAVKDIISLDTSNLNGKVVEWCHYDGPLAILKLCRFVRIEILGDKSESRKLES